MEIEHKEKGFELTATTSGWGGVNVSIKVSEKFLEKIGGREELEKFIGNTIRV